MDNTFEVSVHEKHVLLEALKQYSIGSRHPGFISHRDAVKSLEKKVEKLSAYRPAK